MKSGVKSVKELNLEDDFLFAKVMTDEYVCKIVLEKILNIEIKEVKMPEEQKVINILAENKGVRLDIYGPRHQTVWSHFEKRLPSGELPQNARIRRL